MSSSTGIVISTHTICYPDLNQAFLHFCKNFTCPREHISVYYSRLTGQSGLLKGPLDRIYQQGKDCKAFENKRLGQYK